MAKRKRRFILLTSRPHRSVRRVAALLFVFISIFAITLVLPATTKSSTEPLMTIFLTAFFTYSLHWCFSVAFIDRLILDEKGITYWHSGWRQRVLWSEFTRFGKKDLHHRGSSQKEFVWGVFTEDDRFLQLQDYEKTYNPKERCYSFAEMEAGQIFREYAPQLFTNCR